MGIDRSVLLQVFAVVGSVWILAAYPLAAFGSREMVTGAVLGTVMSVLNILAGMVCVAYVRGKSHSTFLRVVLGGMGVRMAILLGMLFALIRVVHVHVVALIVSLFGFYLIFLVMEILFLQKTVEHRA